ncbi:hypothetical protein [Oceanicella actignis]|uniref:Uncharacterized protein n=1 Tax=Oceanicella actignis TaxID=1189325 RepID=A0A1M7TPC3_9RHOB|nr:hypothetical protein [Oceanicella actignis]TYO85248.1 hypothetical protein LY05_02676 [Oceanicella actignis]SET73453.1 hypothetical protein SAMN04488119_108104 [Oceanicella actignis]SHN72540.1 hypothetical protein SAMN05216200_108105 [Oceanicella actignis]
MNGERMASDRRAAPGAVLAELSPGELLDRMTIHELRAARLPGAAQRAVAGRRLAALTEARHAALPDTPEIEALIAELREVNEDLWELENDLRAFDARGDFGAGFVALARAALALRDRRAELIRRADELAGAGPGIGKFYRG